MCLLFSYGTLQNKEVQMQTFGRVLQGSEAVLLDYQLQMLEIHDVNVLKLSGKKHHPIAVPHKGGRITGMIFEITSAELAQSDKYEVADYQRVLGKFDANRQAWVYVKSP